MHGRGNNSTHVCFDCRITRRAHYLEEVGRCSRCRKEMVNIGYKLRTPLKKDLRGWIKFEKEVKKWKEKK
jgi:ribosomal protein L37AE/L43A